MACLVELVGVEGESKADGGASVELGTVGQSSDTAVVDLDLSWTSVESRSLLQGNAYFGE